MKTILLWWKLQPKYIKGTSVGFVLYSFHKLWRTCIFLLWIVVLLTKPPRFCAFIHIFTPLRQEACQVHIQCRTFRLNTISCYDLNSKWLRKLSLYLNEEELSEVWLIILNLVLDHSATAMPAGALQSSTDEKMEVVKNFPEHDESETSSTQSSYLNESRSNKLGINRNESDVLVSNLHHLKLEKRIKNIKKVMPLLQYKPEKWVLSELEPETMSQLNIAIVS